VVQVGPAAEGGLPLEDLFMSIQLFPRLASRRPQQTLRRKPAARRPLFAVEGLEERLVLAHGVVAPPIAVPAQVHNNIQPNVSVPLTISSINLTSISQLADGTVQAVGTLTGTLLGHNFVTDFTTTILPPANGATCPILDLHLAPIHLDLLGLNVDTSEICLSVSATPGPGNLLGNLLCGVGGLLDNLQTDLTNALGAVTSGGTLDLSGVLTDLSGILSNTQVLSGLNQVLGSATSQFGSPSVTPAGTTNILNLSLGPVDLNLLGLNVHLDNCHDGPVTVSITAVSGPGNLLGNLLSGVAHLLDSPGNPLGGILSHVNQILGIATNATSAL